MKWREQETWEKTSLLHSFDLHFRIHREQWLWSRLVYASGGTRGAPRRWFRWIVIRSRGVWSCNSRRLLHYEVRCPKFSEKYISTSISKWLLISYKSCTEKKSQFAIVIEECIIDAIDLKKKKIVEICSKMLIRRPVWRCLDGTIDIILCR